MNLGAHQTKSSMISLPSMDHGCCSWFFQLGGCFLDRFVSLKFGREFQKIHLVKWNRDLTRPISPKRERLGREIPLFQENPGWWNIIIWPDTWQLKVNQVSVHQFWMDRIAMDLRLISFSKAAFFHWNPWLPIFWHLIVHSEVHSVIQKVTFLFISDVSVLRSWKESVVSNGKKATLKYFSLDLFKLFFYRFHHGKWHVFHHI